MKKKKKKRLEEEEKEDVENEGEREAGDKERAAVQDGVGLTQSYGRASVSTKHVRHASYSDHLLVVFQIVAN